MRDRVVRNPQFPVNSEQVNSTCAIYKKAPSEKVIISLRYLPILRIIHGFRLEYRQNLHILGLEFQGCLRF